MRKLTSSHDGVYCGGSIVRFSTEVKGDVGAVHQRTVPHDPESLVEAFEQLMFVEVGYIDELQQTTFQEEHVERNGRAVATINILRNDRIKIFRAGKRDKDKTE